VVASIDHASDIRFGAVGLDFELSRYCPEFVVVSSKDDLASRLLPFLANLFGGSPTAPLALPENSETHLKSGAVRQGR
jgi:hypothetical protein